MREPILRGAPASLWRDLVRDGEDRAGAPLDEDIEAYLVFVLMRHLGDGALLHRAMALELFAALEHSGRARLDELRDVGDRCLLISGFFPRLAERRRVDPRYFAEVGRGAYANLADATRQAYAEQFARLASAFDAMVSVLEHAAASVEFSSTLPTPAANACVAERRRQLH